MSTLFKHFFTKINQISPLESNFTEVLSTIALMPEMLYFYGKLPKNMPKTDVSSATGGSQSGLDSCQNSASKPVNQQGTDKSNYFGVCQNSASMRPKCVAIVGSRHNTRYGAEIAYDLAYKLAKKGVIIISGLAFGIDSIAHRGCLDAGGTTIAVLGTPIDQIYPNRHLKLATEILEKGGAIISEYAPSGKNDVLVDGPFGEIAISPRMGRLPEDKFPLTSVEYYSASGQRQVHPKSSFLQRNRLISGLSDIVVVAEAASHSGSLNTASHALEQGKDVFAVPGNITSPYSQGCNRLIAQGAQPYTEPNDILRELFPEDFAKHQRTLAEQNLIGDTYEETAILKALSSGLRSGEAIMKAAILPPEIFNQTITMLEIKSRVRPLGANNWTLT